MEAKLRLLTSGESLRNASSLADLPATILETFIPGYGLLSRFMLESFGFDITFVVSAALVIAGLITALKYIGALFQRLLKKFFMSRVQIGYFSHHYEDMMEWIAHHKVSKDSRNLMAQSNYDDDLMLERSFDLHAGAVGDKAYINFSQLQGQTPPIYAASYGTHYFFHNGRIFFLERSQKSVVENSFYDRTRDEEVLVISCLGRSSKPLKDLIVEAGQFCLKKKESMTVVRRPAPKSVRAIKAGKWDVALERPVRPISTVILNNDVKDELLDDINEYLQPSSMDWYSKRGVPYRRGYLLHGPPGTGKSSLAWAIAGIFGLQIHTVSLVDPNLTEEELGMLFTKLPRRCIVLLEDIDAAGLKDRKESKKSKSSEDSDSSKSETAGITLSGLLNAIDGVASHEGHVLIMTTNHPEKLDEALTRPGRIDMTIEFTRATRPQIEQLFMRMYSPDIEDSKPDAPYQTPQAALKPVQEKESSPQPQTLEVFKPSPQPVATPPATPQQRPSTPASPAPFENLSELSLPDLASVFATKIPATTFTPAEIQGYLLVHKKHAVKAVKKAEAWAEKLLKTKKEKAAAAAAAATAEAEAEAEAEAKAKTEKEQNGEKAKREDAEKNEK